jgi:hypothetical protein
MSGRIWSGARDSRLRRYVGVRERIGCRVFPSTSSRTADATRLLIPSTHATEHAALLYVTQAQRFDICWFGRAPQRA